MFLCLLRRRCQRQEQAINVLRALLGLYAYNAPFATFESQARSQIPNDLAALVGRRLVSASETNPDTRLNEARMKMLTGGDPVTARFLNREFFTFVPVAKFILAVNHRPRIRDYSYGFWRRMRLIPFEARFEGEADDRGLEERLLGELSGILDWAVRGCLEWQRRGLEPPAAVQAATASYRTDSDPLAEFLAERTFPKRAARSRPRPLTPRTRTGPRSRASMTGNASGATASSSCSRATSRRHTATPATSTTACTCAIRNPDAR